MSRYNRAFLAFASLVATTVIFTATVPPAYASTVAGAAPEYAR
jgi:hypothetical protein